MLEPAVPSVERPLVVDLDGTLLRSDLLLECGLAYLRAKPLAAVRPLGWLQDGKAALKARLADAVEIDVSRLPYDDQVLEIIARERAKGRKVVLATASHLSLAKRVAEHLGLFDSVIGTEGSVNLNGRAKRDALVELYGHAGFDYAGNAADDLHVWRAAHRAYVVKAPFSVRRRAQQAGNVEQIIPRTPPRLKDWVRGARLHQWVKNLLIFVPLFAAHQFTEPTHVLRGGLAFVLFGMCASSVYLLNDLLDLPEDRRHNHKRTRPIASGHISIGAAMVTWPALLIASLAGALFLLPLAFTSVMAIYYLLTLSYSLHFKRKMVVDVVMLAMLYTMRIIAGGAVFELPLTSWILAFSMFIFFSLAMVKRYAELEEKLRAGGTGPTPGRAYYPSDVPMIGALGGASGYLAVLVLALYINDAETMSLYSRPEVIWLGCPLLLFWITRVWMLTQRGQMHDDPVVFAIKDKVSLLTGALLGMVFWLAR